MTDLAIRPLEASTGKITPDTAAALRGKVRGTVALPVEDGYEVARTIWNAMVDRRPALVVRCLGLPTSSTRSSSRATKSCSLPCAVAVTTSPAMRYATTVS